MKKLLLLLMIPLLVGCKAEIKQKTINACEKNGLYSELIGSGSGYIRCSPIKPNSFEWCVNQCEELFHEQAKTWSNGSESQSKSANECLNICLNQDDESIL